MRQEKSGEKIMFSVLDVTKTYLTGEKIQKKSFLDLHNSEETSEVISLQGNEAEIVLF